MSKSGNLMMNFIHSSRDEKDKDLFFGPIEPQDEFMVFEDGCTIAHLLVKWGRMPSLSQARKNGWDKEIPPGFSEWKIGKSRFWILNRFDE